MGKRHNGRERKSREMTAVFGLGDLKDLVLSGTVGSGEEPAAVTAQQGKRSDSG